MMKKIVDITMERHWPLIGLMALALAAVYPTWLDSAKANTARTECYERQVDVPDADEVSSRSEVWCYRFEDDGSRFIYLVEPSGLVRPELAAYLKPDGTLRHASMNAGKLTIHSLEADEAWNPLGVPLTPPKDAKRVPEAIRTMAEDGSDGVMKIQSLIGGSPTDEPEDITYRPIVEAGEFSAKASYLPWRGFWYPQASGRLHNGANSPMAKYDRFVQKRIGANPQAQMWEKRTHPPREVAWAGHCNGWSATSIMRPEPTASVTDPFTGVTFTVADQKGLWMEADYCPRIAFYGHRNFGGGGDGDIRAIDFHNVVSYYLGQLKKPFAMDLMSNAPVENRVVSGYNMKITKVKPDVFKVATTLTIHSYDGQPSNEPGPAGVFKRTYTYYLEVDAENRPVKGKWLSRHPDFIWSPLAPGECKDKNPVVHEAWLKEIYRISLRAPARPLEPALDTFPAKAEEELKDERPAGAAPIPGATPPPADRQPDGED